MKKYLFIFFLLTFSLLFCIYGFSDNFLAEAGFPTTYTNPNNKVIYIDKPWTNLIILQSGPGVREKDVTAFEYGEYIGIKYKDWDKKRKVSVYKISVVSLKTGKEVYKTSYEEGKKENRFLCIDKNTFTYTLQ